MPIPPSSDNFDEALRNLKLLSGGAAHDVDPDSCWYCGKLIDRAREAWKLLPAAELLAHVDCEDVWMDAPCFPILDDYGDDEELAYLEALEEFVHTTLRAVMAGTIRCRRPELQESLLIYTARLWQKAVKLMQETSKRLGKPGRDPDESDDEYLYRVVAHDADDDADDDEESGP